MQVLCFCRSSDKKFLFVRHQMCPPVKRWSRISVSALHHQWMGDKLVVLLMMFSHKCLQIFCAIHFISQHLLLPPYPPDYVIVFVFLSFLFQLSLQLGLFHSFSLRCQNRTVQFVTKKLFHCQHVHQTLTFSHLDCTIVPLWVLFSFIFI